MDTIKNILAPLAIGLIIGIGGGLFFSPETKDIKTGGTNPDIMSPYISYGGVYQWAARSNSLTTATTTVCAIQSPVATSTLKSAAIRLDTSTTTASVVRIAAAATRYATTTNLATATVAANAQAFITATTTIASNSAVISPSNYIVFSMEGGVGTFSPTGACQATFESL